MKRCVLVDDVSFLAGQVRSHVSLPVWMNGRFDWTTSVADRWPDRKQQRETTADSTVGSPFSPPTEPYWFRINVNGRHNNVRESFINDKGSCPRSAHGDTCKRPADRHRLASKQARRSYFETPATLNLTS